MKCKVCKTEMDICKGERLSDSQYRQVFKCRNSQCEQYGKTIEVIIDIPRED